MVIFNSLDKSGKSLMSSAVPAPFVLSTPAILIGAAPTDLAGIELCEPEWPVFAADGGVHMALANHLDPRAVIGDMDSIGALDQLDPAIKLIHQMKCLAHRHQKKIIIVCCF